MKNLIATFAVLLLSGGIAAAQDEPVWMANPTDDGIALAYAVPESDDIALILECDNSSRQVRLTIYEEITQTEIDRPVTITLSAGGKSVNISGQTTTDDMMGFTYGTAINLPLAAIIDVMSAPGPLDLAVSDARRHYPDTGRSNAVRDFTEICEVK